MASNMTTYLPIPHTESDFNREFQLSRVSHDRNVTDPTPRENVLKSIRCTSHLKRSTNQAFILLVGNTGCGKSSTINHLFALTGSEDRLTTLASVNDEESETRSVQEYVLQCDDHHYRIKDATLSVIDTPGFNDTAGIKQNACNMHSIKSFMDKHPNLMKQKPNLVFICLNVNDNRFKGVHSNFSKSLRILKSLDMIDEGHNNVIGVITHVCSTNPPHTRHEAWTNKMNEKRQSFQTVIQQILNINDAPIVLIENSFEDVELERPPIEGGGYSDYTRLPNGELQPRNLFVACSDIMIKSNDSLGKKLFDACFVAGNTEMKVTKGLEIKANIASDQELTREETKILSWLNEMENSTETALENSNVCNLEQFICQSKSSEHPIQRINTLNKGYDILLGKVNVAEIFQVDYKDIGLGINVPTSCTFEMLNETTDVMELFETREVFIKRRLQDLNVKTNINCAILNFEIGGGYNHQVGRTMETNSRSYSFLREHRFAKLNMGNFASLQLTESFKQSVETLPSQFNSLDDELMFERFFNHWGHFVVTSVYLGGSVTGYVKSCSGHSETFESIREKFHVAIGCSIVGLGISQQSGHDKSLINQLGISISELQWRGGNTRLHSTGTLSDTNKFDEWRNSVSNQPIVLTREMHLEPITTMIGLISRDKERAAELAASHFYKVKLDAVNREREEIKRQREMEEELTREKTVQNHRQKDDGCFSLNGRVLIRDVYGNVKQISLNKLEIGQRVLAWNRFNNDCIYSEVIAFADYEPTKCTTFLHITLENGNVLTITGNHLIVTVYNGRVAPARNVKVGDTLVVLSSSDDDVMSTQSSRVLSIDSAQEQGYLAPVTMSGNLFVDGVLSSCYANVNDVELFGKFTLSSQNIAHMAFLPLRCYYRIIVIKNWSAEKKKKKRMHPYVKWLLSLNVPRNGAHCLLFD